jgi:hypothetical protein
MQIIWNQAAAESLRNSQTVLELETFAVGDQNITAYCVVPAERVFPDIARLDNIKELHQAFISALNEKNYQLCQDIAPELIGRFGGELDSFYQEILDKIKNETNSTAG